jgi:hypothetical protein
MPTMPLRIGRIQLTGKSKSSSSQGEISSVKVESQILKIKTLA